MCAFSAGLYNYVVAKTANFLYWFINTLTECMIVTHFCLSVSLSVHLSIFLSACLFVSLSVQLTSQS